MRPAHELALAMIARAIEGTAVVGRHGHRDDWFATATGSDGQVFEAEASTSDSAVNSLASQVKGKLVERRNELERSTFRVAESLAQLPDVKPEPDYD